MYGRSHRRFSCTLDLDVRLSQMYTRDTRGTNKNQAKIKMDCFVLEGVGFQASPFN